MTSRRAAEWLATLADAERTGLDADFARELSLDTARRLLELTGDPHLSLRAVHIAGTKGKGSVAAMVEAAARQSGLRTGLFTSPHLISWRERVRIEGEAISEDDVARLASAVRPAVEQIEREELRDPSFFEVSTAMALLAFAEAEVELAVVEVGLGGRLDATNVITPLLSVITTLGIDHPSVLGESLVEIAREKAGIIKPDVPVVIAPQPPEAMTVITRIARERSAPARLARPFAPGEVEPLIPGDVDPGRPPALAEPMRGMYAGEQLDLRVPLPGVHQAVNAGVAAAVCEELGEAGIAVPAAAFARGLQNVRWPARVELVEARPWLVVDCAHTRQSARALMDALRRHLIFDQLIVVLGVSRDKLAEGIAQELSSADHALLTQADAPRAMPVEELAERTAGVWRSHEVVRDPAQALRRARGLVGERDLVCVTGSFFVIGQLVERGELRGVRWT